MNFNSFSLKAFQSKVYMWAKSLQSCPTFCDPMDCSLPGSSIHGILQVRILEWVAVPFSRDLPDSGMEPMFPEAPALQVDSLLLSHKGSVLKINLYLIADFFFVYIISVDVVFCSTLVSYFFFLITHFSFQDLLANTSLLNSLWMFFAVLLDICGSNFFVNQNSEIQKTLRKNLRGLGVDSHSLLQGSFPPQRLNLGLLHCRQILYPLSHQGSPIWEAAACI